ncbi:MAG: TetR/AcrR family transcriptional regulator [Rhizobacter sp.]
MTTPRPLANASKAKPLKRPTQARAKVTVQAVFDAFVRIWQRDGWQRLTTRAVALETGIAVGTLYDYFPSKTALLSGYVRHCIETLLSEIDRQAVSPPGLAWTERLDTLVRLCCGVDAPELPWFHRDMLALETEMAEPKHQARANEELAAAWSRVFAACTDLPHPPPDHVVRSLHLAVWGGRRYAMLVQLDADAMARWSADMAALCRGAARAADA